MDADFIHWVLVPRHDKSQAEKQYKTIHKIMTYDKAEKYLALFDKNLDESSFLLLSNIWVDSTISRSAITSLKKP